MNCNGSYAPLPPVYDSKMVGGGRRRRERNELGGIPKEPRYGTKRYVWVWYGGASDSATGSALYAGTGLYNPQRPGL